MNVRMVAGSATVQRTGRPAAASTAATAIGRRVGGEDDERAVLVGDRDHAMGADDLLVEEVLGDCRAARSPSNRAAVDLGDLGDSLGNLGAIGAETPSTMSANCSRSPLALDSAVARCSAVSCSLSTSSWPTRMHSACCLAGDHRCGLETRRRQRDGASGESFVFWNSAIVPVSRQWGRIPAQRQYDE